MITLSETNIDPPNRCWKISYWDTLLVGSMLVSRRVVNQPIPQISHFQTSLLSGVEPAEIRQLCWTLIDLGIRSGHRVRVKPTVQHLRWCWWWWWLRLLLLVVLVVVAGGLGGCAWLSLLLLDIVAASSQL